MRFLVTARESEAQKYARLRELIGQHQTGIIHGAKRKRVEQITQELKSWGVKVVDYHGGIEDEARRTAQNQFKQSECDVVVATNAFGMGIDRADLRFIAHFDIPGSLEAYYQEPTRPGT